MTKFDVIWFNLVLLGHLSAKQGHLDGQDPPKQGIQIPQFGYLYGVVVLKIGKNPEFTEKSVFLKNS